MKKLRIDSRLEVFDGFYANEDVTRHKTVRMTPQQNRPAKRMNKTFIDKVSGMLIRAKVFKNLWAETLNIACYLAYLSPSNCY